MQKVRESENIELITNALVEQIKGDASGVTGVVVKDKTSGAARELQLPGIFVFVGLDVRNEVLKGDDGKFICDVTPGGQVAVNLKMQTSVHGLFAAGDMRQDAPKQVVCAAGDGAVAALSAIAYLQGHDK